jgi:hypothetical protein
MNDGFGSFADLQHPLKHRRFSARMQTFGPECRLMDNFGWGELGTYGGGILRGAPTPRIDTQETTLE